ncbi:PP2C family protein-serine/threonine phosphatase [Microbispora oryzae]|uniref:PP2C family protein-serine/threonine phosphatase n=1 Tax=Microbispora oryzae TaxID=2806554 RepID=UPI0027DE9F8B|nr:PP2C family protein-serine/threonine phosphatase [Microbispora oryzae]
MGGAQPPLPPADDREPGPEPGPIPGVLPEAPPDLLAEDITADITEDITGDLAVSLPGAVPAGVPAAVPAGVPAAVPAGPHGMTYGRPAAPKYAALPAHPRPRTPDLSWSEWYPSDSRRQLVEARERAADERRVTLALREAILPEPGSPAVLPYARIAVRYVPAGKAGSLGGDWYDATTLPDGRMFLAVGDVSGHGLPAIAEMAQLRHALLGLTMTGASPGMLLEWLNALVLNRLDDTTATVVCGYFDPVTRLFTWAHAGHPAPILVRRGGAHQLVAPRGVVLGATPHLRYSVADVRLEPGDLLLMFTDGVVERRTRGLDEGLSLIVRAAAAVPACGDLDAGLDRLVAAIGGPNPEDDTCLLAVGVTGG